MGSPVYPTPFSAKKYLEQTQRGKQTLVRKLIDSGVPRWVTLLDELLFVVGSIIFVVGSLDFFPGVPIKQYIEGCQLFLIGSGLFLGLAVFATYEIIVDARLDNNSTPDPALLAEQAFYVIGSALFAIGTVLFTPELAADPVVAPDPSLAVIDVTWFGRVYEIVTSSATQVEVPDSSIEKGDILFAVGSVLYAVAAFISALRAAGDISNSSVSRRDADRAALRRRAAVATASLYELGGVSFVVGTLGFVPADIVGIGACPQGSRNMAEFGANLFVLGSLLYTLGSMITLGVTAWLTYNDDTPSPIVAGVGGTNGDGDGGPGSAAGDDGGFSLSDTATAASVAPGRSGAVSNDAQGPPLPRTIIAREREEARDTRDTRG